MSQIGDAISAVIKAMPDNSMITLNSKDGILHDISKERIEKCVVLANNIELFHIIFMMTRPGANRFQTYLEHEYYPPGTPENDKFQWRVLKWNQINWCIISIPLEDRQNAYDAAAETKMKIADGIPTMISGEGVERFPLCCDRAFSLENQPNSVIYEPGGSQDEVHLERLQVDEYLRSKGYSDGPVEVEEEDDADWWKEGQIPDDD